MEILAEVFEAVISPDIQDKLLFVKAAFLLVGFFFGGTILFAFGRTAYVQLSFIADILEFLSFYPFGLRKIGRQWRRLMLRLETGSESEYKLAIIEADTILEDALKRMNVEGETTDERISQLTPILVPNLEAIQQAHESRNEIVYNPDYRLTLAEARRILAEYAITFRGLDLMQ